MTPWRTLTTMVSTAALLVGAIAAVPASAQPGQAGGRLEAAAEPTLPALTVTSSPRIAGVPDVKRTLTATRAAFNDATVTITHQWLADGNPIPGATDRTFRLSVAQLGQQITYTSIATRAADGAVLVSNPSSAVGPVRPEGTIGPLFEVTKHPTISGIPQIGRALVAEPTWYKPEEVGGMYRWYADDVPIPGAVEGSLFLDQALLGKVITHEGYARDSVDGSIVTSNRSNAIGPVTAVPAFVKTVPQVGVWGSGAYGSPSTVLVTVSSLARGNVTVTLDGAPLGVAKLVGGTAAFDLPAKTPVGRHALVASYAGSATHEAVATAGSFAVTKGAAKRPTFKATQRPTTKNKGRATISVPRTLNSLVKPTGKIRIRLKDNGVTKTINSRLAGGKRSIRLPKLGKGAWRVTVTYYGDANYSKGISRSYQLVVKK